MKKKKCVSFFVWVFFNRNIDDQNYGNIVVYEIFFYLLVSYFVYLMLSLYGKEIGKCWEDLLMILWMWWDWS